ncbi:MAG TPA: MATE family efflux transporter [Firmicutes bacterium]|jgi:putative MATE family efflux protein|nr:MATE family efflux transporter [Bacillota bacterium]
MAAVRMTQGNIFKHLVTYAIPLIVGNLFQLTYNAVDSIIVGRFIGKNALAAVGTASPVMNIVILGISGICIGAAVLMSEFFGAKNDAMLKKTMATTTVFGFFFSILVAVLGIAVAKPLLQALRVPGEILGAATVYLRITFLGAPFTYFYNAVSAALKSVGDSKTPLKFLAFSAILNGVLDLIFIGGLGFGIACSATTTVIAEATSAILCIRYVYRKIPMLQLKKGEFRVDGKLLQRILQYGGITALQQSCQPVGKLLIQGAINPMGVDMIAAFNAVNRVDDYAFIPQQSIAQGITTFVAQNKGAGKHERIRKGFQKGLLLEFGYWALIGVVVALFKSSMMGLFVTRGNRPIIELGSQYLSLMALFYLFPSFTNGMQGFFRGMGNMSITLIGTTVQTGLRVIFVYLLTPQSGIAGAAYACAIGWSVMLLVEIPYYFWFMKQQRIRKPLGMRPLA